MRSKFKKSIIRNFDLMIDLLVTSTIMRSKKKKNYLNLVSGLYLYIAGLLLVVGGVVVQSDETDRVWSEALLLLHVAVAISN
jgi:hypothetical protein